MIVGTVMMSVFESMTSDELFELHEKISAILSAQLVAKKNTLERRLRQLAPLSDDHEGTPSKSRRPFPG
jgi:hypothetical protein